MICQGFKNATKLGSGNRKLSWKSHESSYPITVLSGQPERQTHQHIRCIWVEAQNLTFQFASFWDWPLNQEVGKNLTAGRCIVRLFFTQVDSNEFLENERKRFWVEYDLKETWNIRDKLSRALYNNREMVRSLRNDHQKAGNGGVCPLSCSFEAWGQNCRVCGSQFDSRFRFTLKFRSHRIIHLDHQHWFYVRSAEGSRIRSSQLEENQDTQIRLTLSLRK